MKLTWLAIGVLTACLFPASYATMAQGVGASGDLTGTVTDPTGAGVPNAKVTVTDPAKGEARSVMTDEHGFYRVSGLAPAGYKVIVEHSGFQEEVANGVVLTVGQTLIFDFHLKLAGMSSQVEVSSAPPIVETERASQANTLTQEIIADLPIDRRDYLTFTLLAPGVSNSTRLASDQDFRVKQTPQSGLSFYGSNGRGNSVTVDGGEANDDAGGVRLTLSQDAVQEFQVNRSNYTAELGGASGAAINIVSKSGGNDLHGSLYSYFRNDALDAADPFAVKQALAPGAVFDPTKPDSVGSNVKNSLTRYQYGGAAGFPIKKDKTFLFAAFEGLQQDTQSAVPLLTNTNIFRPTSAQQKILGTLAATPGNPNVPCLSGPVGAAVAASLGLPAPNPTTNVPAATCAAILGGTLTLNPATNPISAFLVSQFENNGGLFNFATREYLASGRFDHRFSDSNQFTLTYRYGHDKEENPDVHSLTGFTAGSSIRDYENNAMAAWYHQFSSTAQNELRLQLSYTSFDVIPNVPGEVGLQIPGFVNNLGTSIFIPNYTIERRYEIGDNFTMIRGHHTMRFGGDELLRGNHTESHTFFPGRFVFGSLPGFLLTPQLPSLSSLESASFGLPQVFQQGFGNPVYPYYTRPWTALYWQDAWPIVPNFTLNYGLRYELDTQYAPLSTYKKNFGPRVSFAWDPFNNHKTVIRAGYGIFYAPIYEQIPAVDLSLGVLNANKTSVGNSTKAGQVNNLDAICGMAGAFGLFPGNGGSPCNREISIYIVPIGGVPGGNPALNALTVFNGLFGAGPNGGLIGCTTPGAGSYACITPASLAPFGLNVTNSGALAELQVVFVDQPNFRNPYSQQAEFGIERQVAPGLSLSASYIYSHTIGLPVAIDTNLLPAPFTSIPLASGKMAQYRNWNGGVAPGNAAAADPLGGQELNGAGQPVFTAGYPCANPFACFVNPFIVQNNQYTSASSAVYQAGILEVKRNFSNHFTLLGNYTYSKGFDTGTDFNSDYGPQDPTNLGLDRSLSEFDQRHKVVVAGVIQSPWKNPIFSGFQLAPIFTYNTGHPFNLLAGGEVNGNNHTTNERPIGAGRDTGLGPSFTNFDMRLSWEHKVREKASLQFTAEGFNIANHTNYASVNNEVSPLFGIGAPCATPGLCPTGNTTFAVHGIKPGTTLADGTLATPSTPLAFTSVFPKRQIQLGLRLSF
ncbi:MAG TPA: TonB-dependent receptor [Candidatus Acidoferrum sp.]|nr:TonB-dependent receptor [Candidatus Acidoferrum sp.]